jgi:hypothetical protein
LLVSMTSAWLESRTKLWPPLSRNWMGMVYLS